MVRVLFVCMGNICRSPTAHGVFQKLVAQHGLGEVIEIDSAGTHDYHIGKPPDERAQAVARKRGIDISGLRARMAESADMDRFDYVLAMDEDNLALLHSICPAGREHKLRLFLEFAPHLDQVNVPDPYWGGASGFDRVLDMIEDAATGLLDDIQRRHLS